MKCRLARAGAPRSGGTTPARALGALPVALLRRRKAGVGPSASGRVANVVHFNCPLPCALDLAPRAERLAAPFSAPRGLCREIQRSKLPPRHRERRHGVARGCKGSCRAPASRPGPASPGGPCPASAASSCEPDHASSVRAYLHCAELCCAGARNPAPFTAAVRARALRKEMIARWT